MRAAGVAWRRSRNALRAEVADRSGLAPLLVLTDDQTRRIGLRRVWRGELDLVVDGFPGSGNTFVRWAVGAAQPEPPVIGGKIHSPAMMRRAVAQSLPTVLVVRRPCEVAPSTVARWPWMDLETQLERWTRFHRSLRPVLPGLVVAPFDVVTTDLGSIVGSINDRFGTDLVADPALWSRPDPPGGPNGSEARRGRRQEARARLEADQFLQPALRRAEALYDELMDHARSGRTATDDSGGGRPVTHRHKE